MSGLFAFLGHKASGHVLDVVYMAVVEGSGMDHKGVFLGAGNPCKCVSIPSKITTLNLTGRSSEQWKGESMCFS